MPAVTATQSNANLVLRYDNTDVAYEAETKTIHGTDEPMIHGLTNSFQAGSAEPSFVKSDYFTYGVIDGILKDNAISFSGKFDWYTKKVKVETDIEDPSNPGLAIPTIPATDSANFQDHITWIISEGCYARPGRIQGNAYYTYGGWGYVHAWSHDYISAGNSGSMEFRVQSDRAHIMVGFDEQADLLASTAEGNGYSFLNYAFHIMNNKNFRIYESGTHRTEFLDTPYVPGDLFRIERVGDEIRYFHNGNLVYTSAVLSANHLWAGYTAAANDRYTNFSTSIYDCKMNTTRKANMLYLGDTSLLTGRWDPDHLLMDKLEGGYNVTINGVPQLVTLTWNTRIATMPDPLPGEVVISRNAGIIKFNPIEAGNTVNIQYRTINKK